MSDANARERLDATQERNREQHIEAIKRWVEYLKSEPRDVGPTAKRGRQQPNRRGSKRPDVGFSPAAREGRRSGDSRSERRVRRYGEVDRSGRYIHFRNCS